MTLYFVLEHFSRRDDNMAIHRGEGGREVRPGETLFEKPMQHEACRMRGVVRSSLIATTAIVLVTFMTLTAAPAKAQVLEFDPLVDATIDDPGASGDPVVVDGEPDLRAQSAFVTTPTSGVDFAIALFDLRDVQSTQLVTGLSVTVEVTGLISASGNAPTYTAFFQMGDDAAIEVDDEQNPFFDASSADRTGAVEVGAINTFTVQLDTPTPANELGDFVQARFLAVLFSDVGVEIASTENPDAMAPRLTLIVPEPAAASVLLIAPLLLRRKRP